MNDLNNRFSDKVNRLISLFTYKGITNESNTRNPFNFAFVNSEADRIDEKNSELINKYLLSNKNNEGKDEYIILYLKELNRRYKYIPSTVGKSDKLLELLEYYGYQEKFASYLFNFKEIVDKYVSIE